MLDGMDFRATFGPEMLASEDQAILPFRVDYAAGAIRDRCSGAR
jgi:hypothetical protein